MRHIKFFAYICLAILLTGAEAFACDSKGELISSSDHQIKKGECHEFSLDSESGYYFLVTAQQNGVDIDLRLFENDVEIKSADSENSNSGFEFLPFISKTNAKYKIRINWLDDTKVLIKNEGSYKLEFETQPGNEQQKVLVQKLETAGHLYRKSIANRFSNNQNVAADFLSAIAVYKSLPETKLTKYKVFLTNYYLGVFYNTTKNYNDAIAVLEENSVLSSEIEDKYLEAKTLKELGIAYFKTNNFPRSNEMLEKAVSGLEKLAAEKIGEVQTLPLAYIAQAETLFRLNNLEKAIKILENVRADFKNAVNENLLVSLSLADIYFDLGNNQRADEIMSSLVIDDNTNAYSKGVFNKISGKFWMKTDKMKALGFFNRANSFFADNETEKAVITMFIGTTHYYAKDYIAAKSYFEQSKTSFEQLNDRINLAQTLNNLSVIAYTQKYYQPAISDCENALSLNIEMQNELNKARNLINLMYFNEAAGNQTTAIFYGKWAINTLQSIKYQQLQSFEKELQDNFQDSFTDAFRMLANLLIKEGRISEAEQILRFIKEKEYQDYVRGNAKLNGVDYTKREEDLLREAKDKIGKKYFPTVRLPNVSVPLANVSPVKQLIGFLKKQGVDVNEMLFIQTLVNKDNIILIATNGSKQRVFNQAFSREYLNNLIIDFRQTVTDPEQNPKIKAKILYDILVEPLEKEFLSSKIKKVVWSLDGVLRYVPISALFDGNRYLIQRFASIQLSFADDENIFKSKSTEQPAIGMASSKSFEDLSDLPIAKNELDCIFEDEKKLIINSTCKKGIIKGKKVADEDFTQAVFEDALKKYKLIHLTSHFVMQAGDNSKSYLLLGGGNDRKYTMQLFSTQKLNEVEILIMSACNTANFSPDGSEFESFAMMAQKQGAKSVIGTLWSVADVSTSVFMTEFYRFYSKDKLDKAEAIRKAQIFVSKNKRYSHPFYWSPFVLFGNWK